MVKWSDTASTTLCDAVLEWMVEHANVAGCPISWQAAKFDPADGEFSTTKHVAPIFFRRLLEDGGNANAQDFYPKKCLANHWKVYCPCSACPHCSDDITYTCPTHHAIIVMFTIGFEDKVQPLVPNDKSEWLGVGH